MTKTATTLLCAAMLGFTPVAQATATAIDSASGRTKPVYVRSPAPDGGTRMVRLVGPRFLPNDDDGIDFMAIAKRNTSTLDALVNDAVALLGVPGVTGDKPAVRYADSSERKLSEETVHMAASALTVVKAPGASS